MPAKQFLHFIRVFIGDQRFEIAPTERAPLEPGPTRLMVGVRPEAFVTADAGPHALLARVEAHTAEVLGSEPDGNPAFTVADYGRGRVFFLSVPLAVVAGLVALLWSANPALIGNYDATYALIRDSARARSDTRCGDTAGGPNNVYGYGRIDAYSAVARARTVTRFPAVSMK